MALINNMILKLSLALTLITAAQGFQCYVCESIIAGECNNSDKPGQLQDCPENEQNGCFISEITTSNNISVTKGCTSLSDENQYKCEIHTVGTHEFVFCNCHGEGCNKNWGSASGPALKCYTCNSASEGDAGKCDATNFGALVQCPIEKRKGCYMSQAKYGSDSVFERGCTEVTDPSLYVCQDIGKNGQDLHYCNCHGDECNKSWDSAAAGTGSSGAEINFVSTIGIIGGLCALMFG